MLESNTHIIRELCLFGVAKIYFGWKGCFTQFRVKKILIHAKYTMKTFKFLSTLFICIVITNVFAFSMTMADEENTETIHINEIHDTSWENQRTINYLECILYKISKNIKINYSGMDGLNVYILDINDNVVAYYYGSSCDGTIEIKSLLDSGVYRIYIESDTYRGEGHFEI